MTIEMLRDVTNDLHWHDLAHEWLLQSDTIYLNHGSFGPPPNFVRQRRRQWIDKLDSQPMDFFVRQFEPELAKTRADVASFVGTDVENIILVENATRGMNILAHSLQRKLGVGDEVLLNNHEYGAVHRIWDRACRQNEATLVTAKLPAKFESIEQIVDCLLSYATENTKIVVVSHLTSPTALVMPVEAICSAFCDRDIITIVDGPHAPAQIEMQIDAIGCDFYTASCHKWLCASFGTGFVAAKPIWHDMVTPAIQSWGRLLPAMPDKWHEEFCWTGTRDPSAYLSISDAIEYMTSQIGLENFRGRSRYLAQYAEQVLCEEFNTSPIGSRSEGWYASMAHVPLPDGDFSELQQQLWEEYQIEVPVVLFEDNWYLRVSCHLYNNTKQLETLKFAVRKFLI